jgi:hypothetical protein
MPPACEPSDRSWPIGTLANGAEIVSHGSRDRQRGVRQDTALPGDKVLPAPVMASWAASASELHPRGRNLPLRRSRANRPLGSSGLRRPSTWSGPGARSCGAGHRPSRGPVSCRGMQTRPMAHEGVPDPGRWTLTAGLSHSHSGTRSGEAARDRGMLRAFAARAQADRGCDR